MEKARKRTRATRTHTTQRASFRIFYSAAAQSTCKSSRRLHREQMAPVERRIDVTDGEAYTQAEFVAFYGGLIVRTTFD